MTSMCWNETANMLATVQDGMFVVWCYPAVIHFDKELLPLTKITKERRWVGHLDSRERVVGLGEEGRNGGGWGKKGPC